MRCSGSPTTHRTANHTPQPNRNRHSTPDRTNYFDGNMYRYSISTGGRFRRSDIVADALCVLPGAPGQTLDQRSFLLFPGLACPLGARSPGRARSKLIKAPRKRGATVPARRRALDIRPAGRPYHTAAIR
jgi:hypothetical protein